MAKKVLQKKVVRPQPRKVGSQRERNRICVLERRLKLKDVELTIHREFGKESFSNSSFKEKLARFLELVASAFKPSFSTAFLVDNATGMLKLTAYDGPLIPENVMETPIAFEELAAGRVASTGRPVSLKNLMSEPAWVREAAGDDGSALIAVPLRLRKKVTGVLQVVARPGGPELGEEEIRSLKFLTRQFSLVAAKAYVFDDLGQRIKAFATLNEVGGLLISTLKEESIQRRALRAITDLMNAETGSILLLDKERRELFFEFALGDRHQRVKELRLSVDSSIAGWVVKHGKPLTVNDVNVDERFDDRVDKHTNFLTRNIICVPVRVKGKVVGVIQAINKRNGSFAQRDMDIFKLFSSQVAIALENAKLHEELRETFLATSEALAEAIEKRDPYTGGHTKRVLGYSLAIARRLGMTEETVEELRLAAILHDVGKIGIDDRILKKQAPLNAGENRIMMQHPLIGAEILKRVPQLKAVVPGTLYHHERVDGNGYPSGITLDQIPLMARIIAVSDTFDAMTTDRPYRKGLSDEVAIAELKRCSGTQFDPEVVSAFIEAHKNGDFED